RAATDPDGAIFPYGRTHAASSGRRYRGNAGCRRLAKLGAPDGEVAGSMNLSRGTGRIATQVIPPILPIATLLVMWELAARFGLVNAFLSSMPSRVVSAIVEMAIDGPLLTDMLTTVRLLFVTYGVSVVMGLTLGLLAGVVKKFEYGLNPLIWFFYNAPVVAFIPLLMLWFGLGGPTIFVLGLLFGFFPIYVNTVAGIENVDPTLIRLGRSFCLTRWEVARKIVLPAADRKS